MIGDLYNTSNVVVGQAACLTAPANTPPPPVNSAVMADPFSDAPWASAILRTTVPMTAGTYTLSYTYNGLVYTTTIPALNWNDGVTKIQTYVLSMFNSPSGTTPPPAIPMTSADVIVSGGPNTAGTAQAPGPKPFSIAIPQRAMPGHWQIATQTGITPTPSSTSFTITDAKWLPIGATDAGWSFVSNKTTTEINIEEQSTPVLTTVTTQTLSIQGDMAEDVWPTITAAFNMVNNFHAPTASAAGPPVVVGAPGYHLLTPTDTVLTYAVALIMQNHLGYPRWLYIPQATCLANATAAFKRASAKRMYTVDFASVCPINQIAMYDFQNPHT
jgi:hypothetical protein